MTKKQRLIALIISIFILVVVVLYLIFSNIKSNGFSISEKRWIEQNKNQVIDISVLNNLAYFGVDGQGIFFKFLSDLEKETGLKFNKIPYNLLEKPLKSDFVFEAKDHDSNSKMLFYNDFYAILGGASLFSLDELKGVKVGILTSDINIGKNYIKDATFTSYDTIDLLFAAYDSKEISYMVVPYLSNINSILNKNYLVSYRLVDMSNKYVLTSKTKEAKLASIVNKYYNTWMEKSFDDEYRQEFVSLYFENKKINDQTKSSLLSKEYTYGYINNLPYETVKSDKLIGINKQYLSKFSQLTDVSFVYKKYNTISELKSAVDKGNVDIAFGYFDQLDDKVTRTTPVYNSNYVVLKHISNDIAIDSIKSLDDYKVMVVEGSLLNNYVKAESKAEIVKYKTIGKLLGATNKSSIVVIDEITYNYYSATKLKKYTPAYSGDATNNYSFIISNKASNAVFKDIFSYYASGVNKNGFLNRGYSNLLKTNSESIILNVIIEYAIYVIPIAILVLFFGYKIVTRKKAVKQIKKEDKLKFIDMLTSLKNRNYLTYNMPKWDESDIYPQTIVIIDLNNIQYINDNFGHEEGDQVIVDAANILINNQWENSDIVRTDGNEFLIYLVGYKEEEVISYIRKLNKEFKGLTHGFGAALGYSVIKDPITTIDDAINEATLDMRTNKESLQD